MAQDVIILAGIPASGKSISMRRLLRSNKEHPNLAGRLGIYYQQDSGMFVFAGTTKVDTLPQGSLLLHWAIPANEDASEYLDITLAKMAEISGRVEEVQLLVCPYRSYLVRYAQAIEHRKKHLRAASSPEHIARNYERFAEGCQELSLEVSVMSTAKPDTLTRTEKSVRQVLFS